MRYQAALRPDQLPLPMSRDKGTASGHLVSRCIQGKAAGEGMARRRRKSRAFGRWSRRVLLALAAIPALYLLAALAGSLIPVNRGWEEPRQGITVYLADNGIHTDIIMPAK